MEQLLKNKDALFQISGGIIFVLTSSFALLQITQIYWPSPTIAFTYISLCLTPIGIGMYLIGRYSEKLEARRTVSQDEIRTLVSEFERNKEFNTNVAKIGEAEIERIKQRAGRILELDALPLRQILVDLYEKDELITKAKYELTLLKEYEDDDLGLVEDWNKRIKDVININDNKSLSEDSEKKLRYELKSLRETVSYYDKTYAEGEIIFQGVLYWTAITAIIVIFIGLLPIIHLNGNKLLGITHWLSFGIAGALLSVLARIHDPSIPELGETRGKQVLQSVILGIAIGGSASILLYAALSGGILAGKIFPSVPIENIQDKSYWINTGGSIFWGLFAGFSLRVFASLVGVAEGALGKKEDE